MTGEFDLSLHRGWEAGTRPFTRRIILPEVPFSKPADSFLNKKHAVSVVSPAPQPAKALENTPARSHPVMFAA
jgi:hypothetical protein